MYGNFCRKTFIPVFALIFVLHGQANCESVDFQQLNADGIKAMRAGDFKKSEELFKRALTDCSAEHHKTLKGNLAVLYRKMGKDDDALELELQVNDTASGKPKPCEPGATDNSSPTALIEMSDEQIWSAEKSGNLNALQEALQQKALAMIMRDKKPSLEYATLLMRRATVLRQLNQRDSAMLLESRAETIQRENEQAAELAKNVTFSPMTPIKSTLSSFSVNHISSGSGGIAGGGHDIGSTATQSTPYSARYAQFGDGKSFYNH